MEIQSLDYQYLAKQVRRAQVGDSDAFAELYVATYQQQYKFSFRYLKDEFLAQDAVQETYILALKKLNMLRDPMVFVSWLNQINMRVCLDICRKQQNSREVGMDDYTEANLNSGSEEDGKYSPESESIRVDQKNYIIKQVTALPFPESQLIILRYYRDMKIDDIADAMNMSQSSVKRHLNSGRHMLARTIER